MITPKVGDWLVSPSNGCAVFLVLDENTIQAYHSGTESTKWNLKKYAYLAWRLATPEEVKNRAGISVGGVNIRNPAKTEVTQAPQILPAWLDSDCEAYRTRAEKCGFRSDFASARFAAKDIYDRLLANYGTTSPEIAKEKDEARAREATAFLNRRAELVNERCRKENALTPLGDQCRAV